MDLKKKLPAFPEKIIYFSHTFPKFLDYLYSRMDQQVGLNAKAPGPAQIFGNAGDYYMKKYGSTPRHLAKIAEKNHRHSSKNPYSQFRDIYTLEQIEQSPKVYSNLTKLQCCPTSDGAGCAIVASESFIEKHNLWDQAVEIAGQAMATDSPKMISTDGREWAGSDMTRRATELAYKKAGITADDVQVVELHDCFSANEVCIKFCVTKSFFFFNLLHLS
jgi:sterol carrier protein 2